VNNKYYSTFTTMNLGLDDFITSNFLTPERKCPKLDVYVCLFETTLLNFDEVTHLKLLMHVIRVEQRFPT